ncbi:hypothetical protein BS78_07G065800 [Paspalum vaginatum]|nr:hypothetical protein BS78_07G065800 [Paspalum vaginatum]
MEAGKAQLAQAAALLPVNAGKEPGPPGAWGRTGVRKRWIGILHSHRRWPQHHKRSRAGFWSFPRTNIGHGTGSWVEPSTCHQLGHEGKQGTADTLSDDLLR